MKNGTLITALCTLLFGLLPTTASAQLFDNDLDGSYTVLCGLLLLPPCDCNDNDPQTYPGAPELCDGVDNNCDGSVPGNEVDGDSDTYLACQECDDTSATIYPGATEQCNGVDDDCDGSVPANEADADSDGQRVCAGDCDDSDSGIYQGATDTCDGTDSDCDPSSPAGDLDTDDDGYIACNDDCDGSDPTVYPGASEFCDGVDDDCDGTVDESCTSTATSALCWDDVSGVGTPGYDSLSITFWLAEGVGVTAVGPTGGTIARACTGLPFTISSGSLIEVSGTVDSSSHTSGLGVQGVCVAPNPASPSTWYLGGMGEPTDDIWLSYHESGNSWYRAPSQQSLVIPLNGSSDDCVSRFAR